MNDVLDNTDLQIERINNEPESVKKDEWTHVKTREYELMKKQVNKSDTWRFCFIGACMVTVLVLLFFGNIIDKQDIEIQHLKMELKQGK